MKPDSILHQVRDQVDAEQDLDKAKMILLSFLKGRKQTADIRRMQVQVQYQIHDRNRLTSWLYNNIMAFSGMQVIGAKS